MILSMTGYGKACAQWGGKKIHAEIKSLNSKSLDLSTRIAPLYREKEMEVRAMITQALERGKVDFNLWVEKDETQAGAAINPAVVKNYVDQIARISSELGVELPSEHMWDVIVRLPEVTAATAVEELTDEEWAAARQAVAEAIEQLVAFRHQEGAALERKFAEKLDNIEVLRSLGAEITEIRSLGGASRSRLWLQIKANVLNLPVTVTECGEATSLGAAILGAVACGDFADTAAAAARMVRISARIEPDGDSAAYQEYFRQYQKLNSLLMPTFGGRL